MIQASTPTTDSPFDFTFEEFEQWYEQRRTGLWQPALDTFRRLVDNLLTDKLGDLDRGRIRLSGGRVKGSNRLWAKMQKEKYRSFVSDLDTVDSLIDDVIGIRLTCHNSCDMTTLQEILAGLPFLDEEEETHPPLSIQPDSERKYFDEPKESGYRAYHMNLKTLVPTASGGWIPVTGELQARTLLQDGWGELTHEDTYKPGVALPTLATKLARRMADLLATVDDLAQDLRDELDRLAQAAVETPSTVYGPLEASHPKQMDPPNQSQTALLAETKRVVSGLTKQASLAEVAQRVQASFGTDVAQTWGGFGSFTALVRSAIPAATISSVPPGVIWPPGVEATNRFQDQQPDAASSDIPDIISRIKGYDKNLPLVSSESLNEIIEAVANDLTEDVWKALSIDQSQLGLRELNLLSKHARDQVNQAGGHMKRQHADYMLKALLFSGNLRPGLAADDIRQLALPFLYARAAQLGLVKDPTGDRTDLARWLQLDD